MKEVAKLMARLRVRPGTAVRMRDHDPAWTSTVRDESTAKEWLAEGVRKLAKQQAKLYAQDRHAVLVIFQAMDAAGKDGVIRHVMSGINPQGCQVFSFKSPSAEERDHTYLWRSMKALPERGRIGIHNRSYYEEVLVVRVHEGILAAQQLPEALKDKDIWARRYREINAFERYLTDNGTTVVKFFLNVSKAEQKRRFLERIEDEEKNWKFSVGDVKERKHWDEYMRAYEALLTRTSTAAAPWYVIPADRKWFTRLAVAAILWQRMAGLGLAFPELSGSQKKELQDVRRLLLAESD